MRRFKLMIMTIMIMVSALLMIEKGIVTRSIQSEDLRKDIYKFMLSEVNQLKVHETAIFLNDGKSANACVYFMSEVLRRNGMSIPEYTCNTSQLLSLLKENNWEKEFDFRKLKPGDICFTTDSLGDKNGIPTHTYVFMGWVKEGSYDYAYICDNQAKDYENQVYHVRNIENKDDVNGIEKDAFSFFMVAEQS